MCGCLVVFLGAVFPRFTIVMLQLFSDLNARAFDSFWIGFAGFLVLPYTTLAFILMDYWGDPINGFGWVLVMFAFLVDLGSYFGTTQRDRIAAR